MSTKSVLLEPQHPLDPTLEHALVIAKPDDCARNLTDEILHYTRAKGYAIRGLKPMIASRELFAEHYADHEDKPFPEGFLEFVSSSPVVTIVVKGQRIAKGMRVFMDSTDLTTAPAGTIRGDPGRAWNSPHMENLIHGSDPVDNATREISLWFPEIY